jgi:hypothetical protein
MSTWLKLINTFPDHPKVLAAGDKAAWLYICGLCYCSRQMTDGLIPRGALRHLTEEARPLYSASRLVAVGLWSACDEGWRVHDYEDHQRSRAQIVADKEQTRLRVGRHRARNGVTNGEVTPLDTDEIQIQINPGVAKAPPAKNRGTRIPDTFTVTDEMVVWVEHDCRDVDWRNETASFVDYWKSKPGKDAVKLDWVRTWKKWMRTGQGHIPQWARNRAAR